jgi:hypothetical protein
MADLELSRLEFESLRLKYLVKEAKATMEKSMKEYAKAVGKRKRVKIKLRKYEE